MSKGKFQIPENVTLVSGKGERSSEYHVRRADGAEARVWWDRYEREYTVYIADENGYQDGDAISTPDLEQAFRLAEKVERY